MVCPMGKARNAKYAVTWQQIFTCTTKKRNGSDRQTDRQTDMLACEAVRSEYLHCIRLQDIKM